MFFSNMASYKKPARCIQLWMDDVFEKKMDIDSFIRGVEEQRIRDIRYDEWDVEDDDHQQK